MNAQSEELAQRVQAARRSRQHVQKMRLLAAQRAEKLEYQLKHAAESGLRAEIARTLDARGRLQVASKRKPAARLIGIAAFGLLLGAASLGLGLADSKNAAVRGKPDLQAPVLVAAPEDRLKLAYSYNVSLPSAR